MVRRSFVFRRRGYRALLYIAFIGASYSTDNTDINNSDENNNNNGNNNNRKDEAARIIKIGHRKKDKHLNKYHYHRLQYAY